MRRFSLYKRAGIYYCRFWNQVKGIYSAGKSTGKRVKADALMTVYEWENDVPKKKQITDSLDYENIVFSLRRIDISKKQTAELLNILKEKGLLDSLPDRNPIAEKYLLEYLAEFWDFDSSPYINEKKQYGHTIGRRHCLDQQSRLKHWLSFFSPLIKIKDVTPELLQEFQFKIRKELAPKTANQVMSVGACAFTWLVKKGKLSIDPCVGLRRFSGSVKKRGILTPGQAKKLFSMHWNDERCRVGNLVAMTCGLRLGEVQALKLDDVGTDRLFVRHAWSKSDGLKCPKNGEERTVPLLPAVRKELLNLLESSPWGKDGFIFYGADNKKTPIADGSMTTALRDVYTDMILGADKSDKTKRKEIQNKMTVDGICFHSWRHFFAANLANKTELRTVQIATGHKTGAMAEHYANHESEEKFNELTDALNSVFGNLVPFVKEA